ncbi:MAG TPA: hypothetical protein VEL07_00535 [Planctomycetota bacterium]|nr:hypothetical protein [Planctomycetota bacterium]
MPPIDHATPDRAATAGGPQPTPRRRLALPCAPAVEVEEHVAVRILHPRPAVAATRT